MSNLPSLGAIIRKVRNARRWTLAELSEACGIPLSTLSKIENDKLTLTYDRLQHFCQALGISLAELLVETSPQGRSDYVTGRRSLANMANAIHVKTPNYIYNYLCTDLRRRKMIPILVQITAKSLAEFGELYRHGGEEFSFVVDGAITFHSEFYAPVTINKGEGVYIDSSMGHAYLVAEGFSVATILSICASDNEDLQQQLIAEAEGRIVELEADTVGNT